MNALERQSLAMAVLLAKPDISFYRAAKAALPEGDEAELLDIEACLFEAMLDTDVGQPDYKKAVKELEKASVAKDKGTAYELDGHPIDATRAVELLEEWLIVRMHQVAGI